MFKPKPSIDRTVTNDVTDEDIEILTRSIQNRSPFLTYNENGNDIFSLIYYANKFDRDVDRLSGLGQTNLSNNAMGKRNERLDIIAEQIQKSKNLKDIFYEKDLLRSPFFSKGMVDYIDRKIENLNAGLPKKKV